MVCTYFWVYIGCALFCFSWPCVSFLFMKTVLPLGEDPPAITSLCFNHNGKILAASAIDGMIHMFGILAYLFFFLLLPYIDVVSNSPTKCNIFSFLLHLI